MKFLRRLFGPSHDEDPVTQEERIVLKKCLRDGDIVLDVGAHHGKWSEAVLKNFDVELHAFEASADAMEVLKTTIGDRVKLNWNAITNRNEDLTFHVYRDDARLSSLHRRHSVEDELLQAGFDAITVPGITLDSYWAGRNEQIRFLKVDVEGAEYDALRGAAGLLRAGQIDFLQFEYGGTFRDAGTTLRNVWSYLRRYGYRVLRQHKGRFIELKTFSSRDEDYQYSNFIAVHDRLMQQFNGTGNDIELDFKRLEHFDIRPKGALHVGAHKGDEISAYRARKISPVVFVEANPDLAENLRNRFAGDDDVTLIEAAASDTDGTATFNITSMDQSSSLLPLKEHSRLYPKIGVEKQVTVRTALLDDLLREANVDTRQIDFVAMDIQGAELMALRGATGLLAHIRALQLEVNFAELYDGCALIGELDDFLAQHGFIRVKTNTPYDEQWGDALYVKQPLVTCSSVGSQGRFANHVFQYLFAHTYAADHDYRAMTPVWAGDDMFDVVPGTAPLPAMPHALNQTDYDLETCGIANDPDVRPETDFTGYFQYHTRYYHPHKAMIRKHLSFKGAYRDRADQIRALFDDRPGPVAAIHLRRGDYGTGVFFIAPESWYVDWLTNLQAVHPDLSVYIASDDLDAVLPAFSGFPTLTARDLPETNLQHEFFTDFAALTVADHLAISNSSYSFSASMLNDRCSTFMRPNLTEAKLVPYDPWNAPVLLRDQTAEEAGAEFMSERAKNRSKYKVKKLLKGRA